MKTVETIVKGETLLMSAKQVKGGKVQLQFAEIIDNPNRRSSSASELVSLLNKSDSRFSATKARRAWITGEKGDITKAFGIDLAGLGTEGSEVAINKLNPEIAGKRLRVQINETVTPNEYQAANVEATAKKAGANGNFITHKGKYIFSNTAVVVGEAVHTFLEADAVESAMESVAFSGISEELTA